MADKQYLTGNCQEDGCTNKAVHLRGVIEHYVYADFLKIKALCPEHTRAWDERKSIWRANLPPDNPNHRFPSSMVLADDLLAEILASEQEAYERAKKNHKRLPARPTWEARESKLRRQPAVVRLN